MLNNLSRKVAVLVLVFGLIAIGLGGFFVKTGFDKANYLTQQMAAQEITYSGAGGSINGVIDTPQEAQVMADILKEHSAELGNYSQLARNDPNRQQILNAMTMTNSLEMAVMGFGLTDVVKASGAFMVLVGFTFVLISVAAIRERAGTLK